MWRARIHQTHFRIPAARNARAMHDPFAQNDRGRRESRVPVAPAASRAKVIKHTSIVTTGSPVTPSLPCVMVLTAYFVLSPVTGLFCHRRHVDRSTKLDASVGRQDHTTSPSALAPPVLRRYPRPSHPAPNVRDDRDTPLLSGRDARDVAADLGVRSMPTDCGTLARRANYA
jgi:hypothetical protein